MEKETPLAVTPEMLFETGQTYIVRAKQCRTDAEANWGAAQAINGLLAKCFPDWSPPKIEVTVEDAEVAPEGDPDESN